MKKTLKNLFLIMIVLLCIASIFPKKTFAEWNYKTDLNAASNGWNSQETSVNTATKNVMGVAVRTIRIVGTGISIIMLTYVAIKYMSAAPSEKAEFKKSATAYIVGAIVLFASSNILAIIQNFAVANIR